jgi:quercetin dioxygenase-like cupin family protein
MPTVSLTVRVTTAVRMYYDQPITKAAEASTGTFKRMAADEPHPGVTRRALQSEHATVAAYNFRPGAVFPLHSHPQEQIIVVQRGGVTFRAAERVEMLALGGWAVVPGGVEHGVTAGPDGAEILAVVVPRREHSDEYRLSTSAGDRA